MALGINLLLEKNIPVISPGHGCQGRILGQSDRFNRSFQTIEISQQNLFDLYAG